MRVSGCVISSWFSEHTIKSQDCLQLLDAIDRIKTRATLRADPAGHPPRTLTPLRAIGLGLDQDRNLRRNTYLEHRYSAVLADASPGSNVVDEKVVIWRGPGRLIWEDSAAATGCLIDA